MTFTTYIPLLFCFPLLYNNKKFVNDYNFFYIYSPLDINSEAPSVDTATGSSRRAGRRGVVRVSRFRRPGSSARLAPFIGRRRW